MRSITDFIIFTVLVGGLTSSLAAPSKPVIHAGKNLSINALTFSMHPEASGPKESQHNHYLADEFPLSTKTTWLRAIFKMSDGAWYGTAPYASFDDDECWAADLPRTKIPKWTGTKPTFQWYKITPNDTNYDWKHSADICYGEVAVDSTAGISEVFDIGTCFYRVTATYKNVTVKSDGDPVQAENTGKNIQAALRNTLRISVRDGSLTNPVAQWATAWINVPFCDSSTEDEVMHFVDTSCADLAVGAFNMGVQFGQIGHSKLPMGVIYANKLAWNKYGYTVVGHAGVEGDLAMFDYGKGSAPHGPPDGYFDHTTICLGKDKGVWATAGSELIPGVRVFSHRVVATNSLKGLHDDLNDAANYGTWTHGCVVHWRHFIGAP